MHWDWRKFYNQAMDWVINYGPRVLIGIVVFIVGMFLLRILNKWVKKAMQRGRLNPSVRYFLQNLLAIILQILLVILVLQVIGLQLTVVSAIIAGLTVAVGLALSGTLQNFVSGILILVLKPYQVGDNINTQGQEGTVTSIQIFFTVILTFDNKTIIVPNGQLSNSVIVNLSREGKRRMDIDLKFNYNTDIAHIKEMLKQSVHSAQNILLEPAPRVGVSALDADKYTVTVNVWANAHGFYDTRVALNEKIVNDLKAAGVKFPGMT